ncbi:nuclear transport factor 2 family protein [Parapedobacter sp. GCM10030251]|uniref:nuclear transport factor 2 family protein n=1 Tax=Parapedobacter sp. GCM10030251 TaxID=3273419 RepID=UPI003609E498
MKQLTERKMSLIGILLMSMVVACRENPDDLSQNKKVVSDNMAGFNAGDHQLILSCLTDDVVWEMPGVYYHSGKAAFDKEIENEAFEGRPIINVIRMVEESDLVVAEGTVQGRRKGGEVFNAVFCDVFHMADGKIKKLTSYLMFPEPK